MSPKTYNIIFTFNSSYQKMDISQLEISKFVINIPQIEVQSWTSYPNNCSVVHGFYEAQLLNKTFSQKLTLLILRLWYNFGEPLGDSLGEALGEPPGDWVLCLNFISSPLLLAISKALSSALVSSCVMLSLCNLSMDLVGDEVLIFSWVLSSILSWKAWVSNFTLQKHCFDSISVLIPDTATPPVFQFFFFFCTWKYT